MRWDEMKGDEMNGNILSLQCSAVWCSEFVEKSGPESEFGMLKGGFEFSSELFQWGRARVGNKESLYLPYSYDV